MELIISRLSQHHLGLMVSLKDADGSIRHITILNGNESDFLGPVVLLNVDQHVLYGLSHPNVISRIIEKGPQYLITSKEMGHNLFEHGMKASLGKVKINLNYFNTTLETFYTITQKSSNITLVTGKDNQLACVVHPRTDLRPILISNINFFLKESDKDLLVDVSSHIEIDNIRTYTTIPFKPYGTHTSDSVKGISDK